jgi:hypothetical protein
MQVMLGSKGMGLIKKELESEVTENNKIIDRQLDKEEKEW